jgi:hypothetical protein
MGIDIFGITPHKVSRDLKGYTILFYGRPKVGKTTIASQFDKALLLAFEMGYLALPGVMAQPINRWADFKQVLRQLKDEKAHEMFSNIVIDTADIAYDLCEKFVCAQNNVDAVGDMPYGSGYAKVSKEFDEALRQIPQMGYGLILISHSQDKVFIDENGKEFNQIVPTLGNRPRLIVDRMSDIIGFANPEIDDEGNTYTSLYLRGTPRFIAGSRFKYIAPVIRFSYQNLVDAIHDAIDKEAEEHNGKLVTDTLDRPQVEEINYQEQMNKFNDMVSKLQEVSGKDFGTQWANKIIELTNKYLGKGKKITESTPDQAEQIYLIVSDLEAEMNKRL